MKARITLILTLFTLIGFAQKKDSLVEIKFCLKTAPLYLIDPFSGPCLRLGTEFKIHQNIAGYIELGGFIPDLILKNNSGFTVKLEPKVYLNKKHLCAGTYVSAELFYKYQSYMVSDMILGAVPYSREYDVYKNVSSLIFKYGKVKIWRQRFIIDGFVGAGMRYRESSNTLTPDERMNIQYNKDHLFSRSLHRPGSYLLPTIDFGAKIGYRFK